MLYEYQKAAGSPSLDSVAVSMCNCTELGITYRQASCVLNKMMDEGSRFANLEKALGDGAVFALCHKGADAL